MSDEHTKSDSEAAVDASYRAADARQNEKQSKIAEFKLSQDFVGKHGFSVELTPDDAGKIIFGDDKFTIELAPPAVTPSDFPDVSERSNFGFFRLKDTTTVAGTPTAAIVSGTLTDRDEATDIAIPNLTDDIALSAGLCIWLEVPVNGSDLSIGGSGDATINSGSAFPPIVNFTGTPLLQDQFIVPIAKVLTGAGPDDAGFDFVIGTGLSAVTYHLLQLNNQNQLIINRCSPNGPAISAIGWPGLSN